MGRFGCDVERGLERHRKEKRKKCEEKEETCGEVRVRSGEGDV